MKLMKILPGFFLLISVINAHAQTEAPKGYTAGTVRLLDSSLVTGFFKEKIRSNASLQFIGEGNKKKTFDGSDLCAAEIGGEKYLCTRGDFFRIITDGEIKFLQKTSDASSKPIFNGNQAVFANGTEGKPGDYFIYINNSRQLKLITKKNTADAAQWFAGCDEAVAKAKMIGGDISQFSEVVVIYNTMHRTTSGN
jgi:hypothetical protein